MRTHLRFPRAILLILLAATPLAADYKQAVAYYMQGRYDKAIQELKPDLDSNPDWEFGHRLVGLSYLNLKNNALAIASLSQAVKLKSTSFSTYYGLAQAYFNMQKYENAIQSLDQGEPFISKEKEPDKERYRFHHLQGSAHYRLEQWPEALNDLTAAIRISGNEWTDYSQLGVAYFHLNRFDEAIQALKPGEAINSEFLGKCYFKKGVESLSAKQYDQALDNLRKARDSAPKDGYIYYNMAEAYLFQKNYVEAEKALKQALEILPKSAEVHQRLGLVYEKQKKWDLALASYQKANEIAPSPALKDVISRVNEEKKQK